MKHINKVLGALITSAILATSSFSADIATESSELKILPIFTDDNWCGKVEVAAVLGSINFDNSSLSTGANYGVELSFDCPVFTLPGKHAIRQQLTLSHYDKSNFAVTIIEMNPRYFFKLNNRLHLGVGPGIAGVHGDPDNGNSEWAFAVNAGADLKYYVENDIVLGLDLRWQWTGEKDFGAGKQDLDNMRVLAKVGYRF